MPFKDSEKRRAWQTTYDAMHREDKQSYREARKEERRAYNAAYVAAHQSEQRAKYAARRALKAGALIGATLSQKAEIKAIYKRAKEAPRVRCYLCGELIPLGERHVDHIIPFAKGGKHTPSNLAVACKMCNLSKGSKLPSELGLLI